jgi:hypothetical protein
MVTLFQAQAQAQATMAATLFTFEIFISIAD